MPVRFRFPGGRALRLGAGLLCLATLRAPARADADDEAAAAPQPQRVSTQDGVAVVKLTADEIKRVGLEVTALPATTHRADQPALAAVLDLQPLLDAATALAATRADMARTSSAANASRAEYERAKRLHDLDQNISTKDFQAAEAAAKADGAAARAARDAWQARRAAFVQQWGDKLAAWAEDDSPEYQQLLRGEQRLVRITQPGAPHRDTAPAEASVRRPDGQWAAARLVSPAAQVAADFQTEAWYFLVDADGGLLPGLNVAALLPAPGAAAAPGVVVPDAAVVWWQGRAWIYQQAAAGVFARREIATDQPERPGGYFVTGLAAQPVVTRGAQVLMSEENKPAAAED